MIKFCQAYENSIWKAPNWSLPIGNKIAGAFRFEKQTKRFFKTQSSDSGTIVSRNIELAHRSAKVSPACRNRLLPCTIVATLHVIHLRYCNTFRKESTLQPSVAIKTLYLYALGSHGDTSALCLEIPQSMNIDDPLIRRFTNYAIRTSKWSRHCFSNN